MNAENNQPPNDPLDVAIAALCNAAPVDERPSPALIAATIGALQALETSAPISSSGERDSPVLPVPDSAQIVEPVTTKHASARGAASSRNWRRPALWAAALAAALLIAVILTRPNQPPTATSSDERHVGPIVVVEVDPASEFARMDERLAQVQGEMAALADDAQRLMAQQQIDRIFADNRDLLATSQSNWPNTP
jgi:hypothetical protein